MAVYVTNTGDLLKGLITVTKDCIKKRIEEESKKITAEEIGKCIGHIKFIAKQNMFEDRLEFIVELAENSDKGSQSDEGDLG